MDDADTGAPCLAAIDVSSFVIRRSMKLREEGRETRKLSRQMRQHEWRSIAVGRVCDACSLAQADGEFEDQSLCASA